MDYIKFFEDYVKDFDKNTDGIKLKYNHSYRVVDKASKIANSLNLDESDKELVRVCALLHDIGRFTQYRDYNTFSDLASFDHGDRGYEILKENGITENLILNPIKYHNKLEIPENLNDKETMLCKIIRDADKLDVIENQRFDCTTVNCKIPSKTVQTFKNKKMLSFKDDIKVEGNINYLLRMLAYIFDINYKESIKFIKDNDYINNVCDLISKNNVSKEIEEIRNICNEYIESRL